MDGHPAKILNEMIKSLIEVYSDVTHDKSRDPLLFLEVYIDLDG